MEWRGQRESSNVEDRRGMRPGLALGGGGGVLALIVYLFFGGNIGDVLRPSDSPTATTQAVQSSADNDLKSFVGVVLADTEDVWNKEFEAMGQHYVEPKLVLFSGEVSSACGRATTAVGPFYCPGDSKVYIDLQFLKDMKDRLGAGGDFAQAYVIAHEVGHHVQNLLGTTAKLSRASSERTGATSDSVRLELQADFLAGVWARKTQDRKNVLEQGDLDEALRAAGSVGDDRLQKQARGYVVPDSFTHGTSEQRIRWFHKGYETGDLAAGDTFSATKL